MSFDSGMSAWESTKNKDNQTPKYVGWRPGRAGEGKRDEDKGVLDRQVIHHNRKNTREQQHYGRSRENTQDN